MNPAFAKKTAYASQDIIGENLESLILGPESDAETVNQLKKNLKSGLFFHAELQIYTKEKDLFWGEIELQPILNTERHIQNFVLIINDISLRKQAEEEVKSSALSLDRYSSVLRAKHELQTNLQMSKLQKKRALLKLGLETFGMDLAVLFHIENQVLKIDNCETELDHRGIALQAQFDKGTSLSQRILNVDEAQVYFSGDALKNNIQVLDPQAMGTCFVVPLKDANTQRGALAFFRQSIETRLGAQDFEMLNAMAQFLDYEFYRNASQEAESMAKQAAESANQSKSHFIANLSHEFRTPLNAIMGMAELLNSTKLNTQQIRYLNAIENASQSLLHLLNDLFDLSEMESQQLEIASIPFDPLQLCHQAISILSAKAREKSLDIFLSVSQMNPPKLIGDPNRLRQIILNLLSNAIKNTDMGYVQVHFSWEIDTRDHLCYCIYEVHDTGSGIANDQLNTMVKGFKESQHHFDELGHVGKGLNIVHMLSDIMEGQICCDSLPGQGTQFRCGFAHPLEDPSLFSIVLPSPSRVCVFASEGRRRMLEKLMDSIGHQVLWNPKLAQISEQMAAGYVFLVDMTLENSEREFIIKTLLAYPSTTGCFALHAPDRAESETQAILNSQVLKHIYAPFFPEQFIFQSDVFQAQYEELWSNESFKSATILLVEDNFENRIITTRYLENAGYKVDVAEDGETGFNKAIDNDYDLILMDLQLPDRDGFSVTESIRGFEREQQLEMVPIVAFTAHAVDSFRQKAFDIQMQDFITKPIQLKQLLRVVSWWTHKSIEVLAVDDDSLNYMLLKTIMSSMRDLKFVPAFSGPEALKYLENAQPECILLDLEMPEMDGFETLKCIRNMPHIKHTPVIALSGVNRPGLAEHCLSAGFDAFVPKPFQKSELISNLKRLIFHEDIGERASEVKVPVMKSLEQRIEDVFDDYRLPEEIADLLPSFLQLTATRMTELDCYFQAKDFEEMAAHAHKIKGTGTSFGFPLLTELASALEQAIRKKNFDIIGEHYANLRHLVEKIEAYFSIQAQA